MSVSSSLSARSELVACCRMSSRSSSGRLSSCEFIDMQLKLFPICAVRMPAMMWIANQRLRCMWVALRITAAAVRGAEAPSDG